MLAPSLLQEIALHLSVSPGSIHVRPQGGGSINNTFRLQSGNLQVFCKINSATKFPQLLAQEAAGLEAIRKTGCFRVPQVLQHFTKAGQQVLLMEWIEEGRRDDFFWKGFGSALAAMHSLHQPMHGWHVDNYMGAVPQKNDRMEDWNAFFHAMRLAPMVKRCRDAGLLSAGEAGLFNNLYPKLDAIFESCPPSFLHGDLWSGNFICDTSGTPVLIDPAVYYGHPAMDLGMTTLFGGFHPFFYDAYNEVLPFPPNHREQWRVANLYPLLVHLYLFGRSYWNQVRAIVKDYS